jgi:hypothetical protein
MKQTKSNGKNGANGKQNHDRLKCNLAPDEALRRAMLVKPPKDWKYGKRKKSTSR